MARKCTIFILIAIIVISAAKSSKGTELDNSQQLILVISDSWNDIKATVFRFEKSNGEWAKVSGHFKAVLGSNGMAWGIGLHEKFGEGPVKKEGDRKTPAGVFRLIRAMGYENSAPQGASFTYEQIREKTHCVDDQDSVYYNKIVNEAELKVPFKEVWKSSELMKRKDILYKWIIVVDHNVRDPKPGAGSCIFMHVWRSPNKGTAGCTAMDEKDLILLLSWLRKEMNPLLIQLPRAEYNRHWKDWKLPPPELLKTSD